MAARTPTSFSGSVPSLVPRQPILAADADDLYDDQQFVLDKDEMVIGDQFSYITDTTAAGTWQTWRTYYTRAPDMCGTSATISCQFSLLVWGASATNFDVAIYHNGTSTRYSTTISASHTSHIWRAWTSCTLYGDGTENELLIQHNATIAVFLAGVAIFTGS